MTAISDDDDYNNDDYYYVDDAVFESAARDIQNRMSRAVGTPKWKPDTFASSSERASV